MFLRRTFHVLNFVQISSVAFTYLKHRAQPISKIKIKKVNFSQNVSAMFEKSCCLHYSVNNLFTCSSLLTLSRRIACAKDHGLYFNYPQISEVRKSDRMVRWAHGKFGVGTSSLRDKSQRVLHYADYWICAYLPKLCNEDCS